MRPIPRPIHSCRLGSQVFFQILFRQSVLVLLSCCLDWRYSFHQLVLWHLSWLNYRDPEAIGLQGATVDPRRFRVLAAQQQ